MHKQITFVLFLAGFTSFLMAQTDPALPWQQIDFNQKKIDWTTIGTFHKPLHWGKIPLSEKDIPWNEVTINVKPSPSVWDQVDLVGPEYKWEDKTKKSSWWWWTLIPLAGVPFLFLGGPDDQPVMPPDITCTDLVIEWQTTIPPPDPTTVVITNFCPEDGVTITHLSDSSNNGDGCETNPLIISRTFQVSDNCGNTTTCTQQITIIDTQPPTITTPATDAVFPCDGAGNEGDIQNWLSTHGGAVASDIHGPITWSNDYTGGPGSCGDQVMVTFTATDVCGNATTTTASLTIEDLEAPVIEMPQ
jgi:hypothetical protein